MYEAPKLVRFGQFRDLTLQIDDPNCLKTAPWTNKNVNTFDSIFPFGTNDGCAQVVRS
jgi:hypothetical protein